jgi:hypothetical protein
MTSLHMEPPHSSESRRRWCAYCKFVFYASYGYLVELIVLRLEQATNKTKTHNNARSTGPVHFGGAAH